MRAPSLSSWPDEEKEREKEEERLLSGLVKFSGRKLGGKGRETKNPEYPGFRNGGTGRGRRSRWSVRG